MARIALCCLVSAAVLLAAPVPFAQEAKRDKVQYLPKDRDPVLEEMEARNESGAEARTAVLHYTIRLRECPCRCFKPRKRANRWPKGCGPSGSRTWWALRG